MKRFSKRTLANQIYRNMQYLKHIHSFDDTNGTAQCAGRGEEFTLAYGRYEALRTLMEYWDLWGYVTDEINI